VLTVLSVYGSTEASSAMVVDVSAELRCQGAPPRSRPRPAAFNRSGVEGAEPLVSLGKPMHPSVLTFVLDDNMLEVTTPGKTGTLHLSGNLLFDEYLGIEDPAKGPLYNTHDQVQILADGLSFRFVARTDDMVKMRGFRVQLGEMEYHIMCFGGVSNCAVLLDESTQQLTAFVTPETVIASELLAYVSTRVPDYMIPRSVLVLEDLPRTANSKIDRMLLATLLKLHRQSKEGARSTEGARHTALDRHGVEGAEPLVKKVLFEVTGVMPADTDRLGDLGLDSIRVVAVSSKLKQQLSVPVPDTALLGNPSVEELVRMIEASTDGAPPIRVNLAAVSGLRFVLSLWVMRGHLAAFCDPGGLGDTAWADTEQSWRTLMFMVIGGMTVSMQIDEKNPPTLRQRIVTYILPLFPVYWIGMTITAVPQFSPCAQLPQHWAGLIINTILGYGLLPLAGYMSHCWFLTSHITFVLMINRVSKTTAGIVRDTDPATSAFKYITLLTLVMCVPRALGYMHIRNLSNILVPFRAPTFVAGHLLGRACMKSRLTRNEERVLGPWTDFGVFALLLLSVTPVVSHYLPVAMFVGGDVAIAFLIFGMSKTDCYASRFLSLPFISGMGGLSYAIYILHNPVIMWARYVYYNHLETWNDVLTNNYAGGECMRGNRWEECQMFPFAHVTVFALVICIAYIATELVHLPLQKRLN